ncbi:hypothetical protein BKA69DRAFT_340673 [Paraphysoderma sedebokerense]|nr:hypothetical protein BKA69DRAFT_340673 [Paraphysoderma sedebokerense]
MTTALHHFLSSKHTSIHPDWVTQCRDFLLSTSPHLSPSQLQDQIWTQFLHSNLREIGIEALKNQIWDLEVKNARTGWVIVQVEQVYDVGQSSFGLLDELENLKNGPAGNANGDLNSTGRQYQDQRGDKKKISRGMLKLKLTDGFHDIWGMEYKPIPELNLLMPRGVKVTITLF